MDLIVNRPCGLGQPRRGARTLPEEGRKGCANLAAGANTPAHPDDGYRVVLGPYPTREQAEAIGRKLGRPFWIYQPGQP